MTETIRIIDLFEAVMERPYLYTIKGSFVEAVAYLDGCEFALIFHHLDIENEDDARFQDVKKYMFFKSWLARKFEVESTKAMEFLNQQENAHAHALDLYQEYLASQP